MLCSLGTACCLILGSAAARAQANGADYCGLRLVSEGGALVPGTTVVLGLVFEHKPGWHSYQPSQNDSGSEAQFVWSVPEGVQVGTPIWPAGHRSVNPGQILDHVYESKVLVMVPVSISNDVPIGGSVTLGAQVEWLVCDSERCVPAFAEVSLTLPVQAEQRPSEHAGAFEEARAGFGTLLTGSGGQGVRLTWEGRVLKAQADGPIEFIPGPGCAHVRNLIETGTDESGALHLDFSAAEPEEVVTGWFRVQERSTAQTKGQSTGHSGLWLLRTRVGEPPRLNAGGPVH
jgi:hypothetical protein